MDSDTNGYVEVLETVIQKYVPPGPERDKLEALKRLLQAKKQLSSNSGTD